MKSHCCFSGCVRRACGCCERLVFHEASCTEATLGGSRPRPSGPAWDPEFHEMPLTFEQFSRVNTSRCARWHPGFPGDGDMWTGADWANAAAGEMGEACNVVKKLRRIDVGQPGKLDPNLDELIGHLAAEIADTVTYLDLLATYYGIDLTQALREKFNLVSEREGFPERL